MSSRVWVGLLFLLFGVGFLMHQAEILDFINILSAWWPLILIIIGIVQLVSRTQASFTSGFLFLLVGSLFLANQLLDVNFTPYIWPLLLIFIGLLFVFSRITREKHANAKQDINTFALFSGADIRNYSTDFQGGTVTAVLGGAEIDLRDATVSENGATLDLSAVFGGISVTVPENVQVEVKGIPILGGWEDKTRRQMKEGEILPILHLNCLAVCGGVEIKD